MNPFRIAAGVVSLLSEMLAREYRRVQLPHWPDGEQPLIDESQLFDDAPFLSDSYLRYSDNDMQLQTAYEPPSPAKLGAMEAKFEALGLFDHPKLGGWYREMFGRSKSSAESTAPEAGVDVAEKVPTPGRGHTPGVGRNVTAGLLISASIGLRDYADSDACEAPVYWRSIASQLDPK